MNSLNKIHSIRFTKNAGLTLAALCGFLTRAASKTKSLSVRSLGIALIAGLSLVGSEKAIAQGLPSPVTIILDNTLTSATSTAGPFTASGGLNTSGFNTMVVRATRTGTLHCQTVLTNTQGSITLNLECRMIPTSPTTAGGPGNWVVVSGTGAYANLHGKGSLTMDINFVTGKAVETMVGFVFFDRRP